MINTLRKIDFPTLTIKKCSNPTCNKEFKTENRSRKYCCEDCYKINQRIKEKQRRKKHERTDLFCLWCHNPLEGLQKKYCESKCGQTFKTIQKRIFKLYCFEIEAKECETSRLQKLGKYYQFPKKHEQLNNLYNLKGDPKNA